LLSHRSEGMNPRTEMLLFCSSRAELVASKILPTLQKSNVVIADRYRLSTEIYQGVGRGLPIEEVKRTLDFATQNLQPDFTFILDLSYEKAVARKRLSGLETDRMESAGEQFYRTIQRSFLSAEGKGFVHLEADSNINAIHNSIWNTVVHSDWWVTHHASSVIAK